MSAFSVLFGDPDEGVHVNDMIDPRSVLVRSLFEVMMRRVHPQLRWGATGLALRSYLCMLGTPRRAADILYNVTGCGSSASVDLRSRERNRICHLHFVLGELVRNRRVVLAIDNSIVRVLQNIGRHGSYLLNNSTNFIMTVLLVPPVGLLPKYPVEIHGSWGHQESLTLATMLGCSVLGCSSCLDGAKNLLDVVFFESWTDPCSCFERATFVEVDGIRTWLDTTEECMCVKACPCLMCRNNAVDVDYVGRGARLILTALARRVAPRAPYASAYVTLDTRAELLSAETSRAQNLQRATVALAGGTFAMLQTESVYVQIKPLHPWGVFMTPI